MVFASRSDGDALVVYPMMLIIQKQSENLPVFFLIMCSFVLDTCVSYNLWSPQATHLYGGIAPTVSLAARGEPFCKVLQAQRIAVLNARVSCIKELEEHIGDTYLFKRLPEGLGSQVKEKIVPLACIDVDGLHRP